MDLNYGYVWVSVWGFFYISADSCGGQRYGVPLELDLEAARGIFSDLNSVLYKTSMWF